MRFGRAREARILDSNVPDDPLPFTIGRTSSCRIGFCGTLLCFKALVDSLEPMKRQALSPSLSALLGQEPQPHPARLQQQHGRLIKIEGCVLSSRALSPACHDHPAGPASRWTSLVLCWFGIVLVCLAKNIMLRCPNRNPSQTFYNVHSLEQHLVLLHICIGAVSPVVARLQRLSILN
eukprot:280427-Amphidinium_carterae.1